MEQLAIQEALLRPIHGTNPLNLVEKIVRQRIFESNYWLQHCFAMNAALLVERASELEAVGGVTSETNRPSPFLCLSLKLLQILPEEPIVDALLHCHDFKYSRALAAFFVRLTGAPADIYSKLEPMLADYSKLRLQTRTGWELTTMDSFVALLLNESYACDITLPRLPQRRVLEVNGLLPPYTSPLADKLKMQNDDSGEDQSLPGDVFSDNDDLIYLNGKAASMNKRQRQKDFVDNGPSGADSDKSDRSGKVSKIDTKGKEVPKTSTKAKKTKKKRKKDRKEPKKRPSLSLKQPTAVSRVEGCQAIEPGSIEEQNKIRARLGLAPLKP